MTRAFFYFCLFSATHEGNSRSRIQHPSLENEVNVVLETLKDEYQVKL